MTRARRTDRLPGHDPVLTAQVTRGVRRLFASRGWGSVSEFTLKNGRRADILALAPDGTLAIVEVKSGMADLRADHKWPDYLAYCDCFYFAVDAGFPLEALPDRAGVIVADAYEAEIVREGPPCALHAARRKAVTLRLALMASQRLATLQDPAGAGEWGTRED